MHRQDQNAGFGPAFDHHFCRGEAVHIRHVQIHQDDIGAERFQLFDDGPSGIHDPDDAQAVVVFQHGLDTLGHHWMVIRDQHSHNVCHA